MFRSPIRQLNQGDAEEIAYLCDQDPVSNVMVHSVVLEYGVDARQTGGAMWGYFAHGALRAICWCGGNTVPVALHGQGFDALFGRIRRTNRRTSSLVGPADQVLSLWSQLQPHWGPAREVRPHQPLMVMKQPPQVEADPGVVLATTADADLIIPACIAMFTEEVGYSPVRNGQHGPFARRILELIESGRLYVSYTTIEGRKQVAFKAEIGAYSRQVAQIQGVWVNPNIRGIGLGAHGMAAVVQHLHTTTDLTPSLYVNDFNTRALNVYRKVGFTEVGEFATVLL